MERKYIAIYDTGHDTGDFEFYSEHRAGSKANLEDAESKMRNLYGRSARNKEIIDIYLLD